MPSKTKVIKVDPADASVTGDTEHSAATYVSMEAELLRTAATRDAFNEFRSILTDKILLPEAQAILSDMGSWYEANPAAADLDWSSFLAWSRIACRATMKPDKWEVYEAVAKHAASLVSPNPAILARYRELRALAEIRTIVDGAVASHKPTAMEDIVQVVEAVVGTSLTKSRNDDLVTDDWRALIDTVSRKEGLEWRLEDLNRAIGPIDKGDSIMIGKRPEVGGTTFLASELSYMVPQLPEGKNGIIFTNEEVGAKVKVRVIQAALGATLTDISSDPAKCRAQYEKLLGGRRIDVVHSTAITDRLVERWLRTGEYGIIGINVLDKVLLTGSSSEGVDLKRDLGIWARGVADKYGAVISILQAGHEAEGQKWPDQSCLYGSKTGLQAESDVLIMIGKTSNPAESGYRFMGVVRNKLPGGARTVPTQRHGQFQVAFDGERGRFKSMGYK